MIPNHEQIATPIQYDWSTCIYGNVKDELSPAMPAPHGKLVPSSTYQDANLCHDHNTGRAIPGFICLINQTPIASFAKTKDCRDSNLWF
jgi:hypothetical protein